MTDRESFREAKRRMARRRRYRRISKWKLEQMKAIERDRGPRVLP